MSKASLYSYAEKKASTQHRHTQLVSYRLSGQTDGRTAGRPKGGITISPLSLRKARV